MKAEVKAKQEVEQQEAEVKPEEPEARAVPRKRGRESLEEADEEEAEEEEFTPKRVAKPKRMDTDRRAGTPLTGLTWIPGRPFVFKPRRSSLAPPRPATEEVACKPRGAERRAALLTGGIPDVALACIQAAEDECDGGGMVAAGVRARPGR